MDKIFSSTQIDDGLSSTSENKRIERVCNYDIILGHSQGAILTAALLSIYNNELLWKSSSSQCDDSEGSTRHYPLGYILNGCAWPNPYQNSLSSLTKQQQQQSERKDGDDDDDDSMMMMPQKMLFIMGKNDKINPIESAMQVHDVYKTSQLFDNVSIVHHDGGHSVPIGRDEDSARALEEVADWIMDIAKRKIDMVS